jgi:small subunit ribosomal protein S13
MCNRVGVRSSTKLKELRSDQVESLYSLLTWYNGLKTSSGIHKNLIRFTRKNKERLVKLNCHRGRRLRFGYPSRGQRTRSNSRNSRGARVVL